MATLNMHSVKDSGMVDRKNVTEFEEPEDGGGDDEPMNGFRDEQIGSQVSTSPRISIFSA